LSYAKRFLASGTWQLPGGHLEFGEDVVACAERETKEETGIDVIGTSIVAVTNDVFEKEGKHYITLFVWCKMRDANATPKVRLFNPSLCPRLLDSSYVVILIPVVPGQIMEPDKCDGWVWKTWEELKALSAESGVGGEELFLPLRHLVDQRQSLDDLKAYRG
jgi:8-oxo-dGTP diphosphatase